MSCYNEYQVVTVAGTVLISNSDLSIIIISLFLLEDSEEEYHNDYTFSSLMSPAHSDSPKAPTFLMTSLTIDEGTVSMILPTKA